jgi:teichuronic acid biosynthesis glycosyltransferase TuaG
MSVPCHGNFCDGDLGAREPLVSVVMPAYNANRTIASSIKSVQRQSYANWELLVVDDCSTDDTGLIVRDLATIDGRIRLISLAKNSGRPAYPRNVAIKEAAGEFISFLDADDEWQPIKLKKQVSFMARSKIAFSCSGYDVISFAGEEIGSFNPPMVCSYNDLLANNSVGCLTVMYDVRILGKQYFPICGHEDYALWLKILREGHSVHGLQEPLSRYRLTPGSASSSKLKVLKFFWNIYKNQEGFSHLVSALFCLRYAWNARGKYDN